MVSYSSFSGTTLLPSICHFPSVSNTWKCQCQAGQVPTGSPGGATTPASGPPPSSHTGVGGTPPPKGMGCLQLPAQRVHGDPSSPHASAMSSPRRHVAAFLMDPRSGRGAPSHTWHCPSALPRAPGTAHGCPGQPRSHQGLMRGCEGPVKGP